LLGFLPLERAGAHIVCALAIKDTQNSGAFVQIEVWHSSRRHRVRPATRQRRWRPAPERFGFTWRKTVY